ncbi:hypothetical protein GCM10022240_06080 [Microbacterium kribbense]|uniref:Uncharacterized protein n=1 Tax=Microbacterium kribbense TaxID=433645 RepID=A0ABP7G6U2_9MICO
MNESLREKLDAPHVATAPGSRCVILRAEAPMNEYGRMARGYWRAHRPDAYAQTENPDKFFTWMGHQISRRVAELTPQLAGRDRPGEHPLDKGARLDTATAMAVGEAFNDFGIPTAPPLTRLAWERADSELEAQLHAWAETVRDQGTDAATDASGITAASRRFLLTEQFLTALVSAPDPQLFLNDPTNRAEWEAGVERRWARDRMPRPT